MYGEHLTFSPWREFSSVFTLTTRFPLAMFALNGVVCTWVCVRALMVAYKEAISTNHVAAFKNGFNPQWECLLMLWSDGIIPTLPLHSFHWWQISIWNYLPLPILLDDTELSYWITSGWIWSENFLLTLAYVLRAVSSFTQNLHIIFYIDVMFE